MTEPGGEWTHVTFEQVSWTGPGECDGGDFVYRADDETELERIPKRFDEPYDIAIVHHVLRQVEEARLGPEEFDQAWPDSN